MQKDRAFSSPTYSPASQPSTLFWIFFFTEQNHKNFRCFALF